MDTSNLAPGRFTNLLALTVGVGAGLVLCVAAGQPVAGVLALVVAAALFGSVHGLTSDDLQWKALGSVALMFWALLLTALLAAGAGGAVATGRQGYTLAAAVALPAVVALALGLLAVDVTAGFERRDLVTVGTTPVLGLALAVVVGAVYLSSYRIVSFLTGLSGEGSILSLLRQLVLEVTGVNPLAAVSGVVVLGSVAVKSLLWIANDDSVRLLGRLAAGVVVRLGGASDETDGHGGEQNASAGDPGDSRTAAAGSRDAHRPVHYREATAAVERAGVIRRRWSRRLAVLDGWLSTAAVLGVVFGGLVLALGFGSGERWVRLFPASVVGRMQGLGTLEPLRTVLLWLVQTTLLVLVVLWLWHRITVARVRQLGDSAGYAAGPLLAIGGLTVAAPALVGVLRETTAIHYILVPSTRGGTPVSVGDASFVLYLDPSQYTVSRSTLVFRETLANVVNAVGAPTLAVAPVAVALVLVLAVCCGVYVVTVLFAPRVRTGTAIAGGGLFLGAVLALVSRATPLLVVLVTPVAFYCWHLRRNPPTLAWQVDSAAVTRRGEAVYAALGGGYLFGLAGGVVGLTLLSRRLSTGGEPWRLLAGVVLAAGVTLTSLVALRLLEE